jgi:hypothetical protein
MDTIKTASAAVTGARHARIGKNGQDAAATWVEGDRAAIVVCDGCSAGASSEVGARLGASLWIRALASRLAGGADIEAVWDEVRADVVAQLAALADRMPPDAVRDCFLFTIVSAAIAGDRACVWALGDGTYAIDGRARVLGPFPDNQPPYLGYDLLGAPFAPHVELARGDEILVATDGALDLDIPLAELAVYAHPDGLRRKLAVLARPNERVDWDARRVVRTPASLQDDCAIAAMRRLA